jgi:DNA-binding HxlR family transcriptional regulator
MAALDLLGRRWTLRILWELRLGALRFRQIQDVSAASPSVLNDRLHELRHAGIVALSKSDGYRLTPLGMELLAGLAPLKAWSERWAGAMAPASQM